MFKASSPQCAPARLDLGLRTLHVREPHAGPSSQEAFQANTISSVDSYCPQVWKQKEYVKDCSTEGQLVRLTKRWLSLRNAMKGSWSVHAGVSGSHAGQIVTARPLFRSLHMGFLKRFVTVFL